MPNEVLNHVPIGVPNLVPNRILKLPRSFGYVCKANEQFFTAEIVAFYSCGDSFKAIVQAYEVETNIAVYEYVQSLLPDNEIGRQLKADLLYIIEGQEHCQNLIRAFKIHNTSVNRNTAFLVIDINQIVERLIIVPMVDGSFAVPWSVGDGIY